MGTTRYRVTILVGFPGKPGIDRKVVTIVDAFDEDTALQAGVAQLRDESTDVIWGEITQYLVERMNDGEEENDPEA